MYTFNQENKFINEEFMFEDVIENCLETFKFCRDMIAYELNMESSAITGNEINELVECAEICEATIACLISRSKYSNDLTMLCAKVCADCKESQSKISNGDERIIEFIETLEICSNICKNFEA